MNPQDIIDFASRLWKLCQAHPKTATILFGWALGQQALPELKAIQANSMPQVIAQGAKWIWGKTVKKGS